MNIQENASLIPFNTFGIHAKAKYLIEYTSAEELIKLLNGELIKSNSFLQVGKGSNLLFTSDYDGIILHSLINFITVISETETEILVEAGAGVKWDDLVKFCVENGWGGIENLTDIPGETGAAAVQNIGAYGVEIKDVIKQVNTIDTFDKSIRKFLVSECEYGYRTSIFKHKFARRFIVTSVVLSLSKKTEFKLEYQHLEEEVKKSGEVNLKSIRNTISKIRSSKLPDPAILGNAGSFFMNPVIDEFKFNELLTQFPQMPNYRISTDKVKIPAGWLIEQCGWKGKSLGNAAVHQDHSLVIINKGNAEASEIVNLGKEIINSVDKKFGITLKPEVIYV